MALHTSVPLPHFTTTGVTDDAKNTDLVIYLMDLLELQRDAGHGIWLVEKNSLRTLSNTCQVVDAANLLHLPQVSDNLVTTALKWLIDLPLLRSLDEEEQARVRIYPSRFKTLAALRRFEGSKVRSHLTELSTHLNPDSGLLEEVPVEDLKPPLRTMIWLDALWYLEQQGVELQAAQAGREIARSALVAGFQHWLDPLKPASRLELKNDGDASYALDLLLRSGCLSADSELSQQGFERLLAAVRQRRARVMRNADAIYCGIQLSMHLPTDPTARDAVGAFISELRERYLNRGYSPDLVAFHALVLRLLASYYGERLKGLLFETNWMRRRAAADQESRSVARREEQEIVKLLQSRFDIRIAEREELSSLHARNQVFRIHFGFKTDAADAGGHPMETGSDHLRLIVKRAPLLALTQAIQAYTDLPEELNAYFVKHTPTPYPSSSDPMEPWYLVMEDLAQWTVLGKELERLDAGGWGRNAQEQLAHIVTAISTALRAIHSLEIEKGGVEYAERLYFSPLEEQINQLSEPTAFPALKSLRLGDFEANDHPYHRFNSYKEKLKQWKRELAPPRLTRIHGDCHSRNLMLSNDLRKIKFIDLENMAKGKDYLSDYALLIEDVAFYRFLQVRERATRVVIEELPLSLPGDKTEGPSKPITKPILRYPAFPVDSQVALDFQSELLKQIEPYAQQFGDTYWKERLWLAIACALVLLSSRQMQSRTLEQRRQSYELRFVLISYVEAMRLLQEIIARFKSDTALTLPFRDSILSLPKTPHCRESLEKMAHPTQILYRQDTISQIVRLLDAGESCAVVGVGSSGKSNIARHLAAPEIRKHYFARDAGRIVIVYLNCKPYALRPTAELYLYALDQLAAARAGMELFQAVAAEVEALAAQAQANLEVAARRSLERAVARVVAHGAEHVILILDDCDDLFAKAPAYLFSDLRALRDSQKIRLVYLILTRHEPGFLRLDTPEYEELDELLSPPGHTLALPPYSVKDGHDMLTRLGDRETPPRTFQENELQRLYDLGGGHAGLMRALFFALRKKEAERNLPPDVIVFSMDAQVEDPALQEECNKIWASLEPEEHETLFAVVQSRAFQEEDAARLVKRGLLKRGLRGNYEFFSPIFENDVRRRGALPTAEPTTPVPDQEFPSEPLNASSNASKPPTIEIGQSGMDVRVNGMSLSPLDVIEYALFKPIVARRPQTCAYGDLLQALHVAERGEPSSKTRGAPLDRLARHINTLNAKLIPFGLYIERTPEGFGILR